MGMLNSFTRDVYADCSGGLVHCRAAERPSHNWPPPLPSARHFLTLGVCLERLGDIRMPAGITSKLTSQAKMTIPQPVRVALNLHPGDEVVYRIDDGQVLLTKATAVTRDDPFRAFEEWSPEADRRAYGNL